MTHDGAGRSDGGYLKITFGAVGAFIGTCGGILTTFAIVQPWTLYYLGLLKIPVLTIALMTAFFFVMVSDHRRRRRRPLPQWVAVFNPTANGVLWLIVAVSVVGGSLLLSWSQPTRQQVAQEILNGRGMFLQPLFYKTALEGREHEWCYSVSRRRV